MKRKHLTRKWKSVYPYSVLGQLKGNDMACLAYMSARWKRTKRQRKKTREREAFMKEVFND